jgi:hypothetical protein
MAVPFTYTQGTPSVQWTIIHNFGRVPACDVVISYNGSTQKVLPYDVEQIDDNTVVIKFSTPQVGVARLS